jgi:hypothetical protein
VGLLRLLLGLLTLLGLLLLTLLRLLGLLLGLLPFGSRVSSSLST